MLKIKNPYPGFHNGIHRAYEREESDLFYGRDQDISNIKLRLRQNRLVALISAPKAGKTSFLRAGVMSNFDKNLFNGINGPRWKSVYFTPESDPVLSMARAIVNPKSFLSEKIKPNMEEEVLKKLVKNDYGLIRVAEDIIGDQTYNLLMVIDDFADLFSRKVEEKRRNQFVNLISKAVKSSDLGFYCIISMNLEDLSNRNLKEYEDLYKSVMKGNYQLRFLDQMGLKDAIDIPAKIEKSEVEENLSLQLIEELISDPDQLRKLQIYMSRTWFEWKINHKDKYIDVNHFLKATGQRQKVGLGGNKSSKSSSIKIKGDDSSSYNPLSSGNLATGSISQDFEMLDEANQKIVSKILQVTLKSGNNNMIDSAPKDLELISAILGVHQNEVIKLVNAVSSILVIDRKLVSISNIDALIEWPKTKEFIELEEEAAENYKMLADASILHYIEGIDIDSVFAKDQYVKVKLWYDEFLPTEEWSKLYHTQYELAIDMIGKLEETFGPVPKQKPKPKVQSTSSSSTTSTPSTSSKPALKFKIKKPGDDEIQEQPSEDQEISAGNVINVEHDLEIADVISNQADNSFETNQESEGDLTIEDQFNDISEPEETDVVGETETYSEPLESPKKIVFKGRGDEEGGDVRKKIVIKKK